MKLQPPLTCDYDPTTKLFRIAGANSLGKRSTVEFPIEDENLFIGWLIAALHEKSTSSGGHGKGILVDGMSFGLYRTTDGQSVASFTFSAGDLKLSFAAGIHASSPERLAAIKAHLEQALLEMGYSQGASLQ